MFFNIFNKPILVTHNGGFHPDDVFSVAVLLKLDPSLKVVRTRDSKKIAKADCVVDVGGVYDKHAKRFDHHQEGGAGTRDNEIPYASFGLVWKEFGATFAGSQSVADYVDKNLVQYVDAMDNGVGEMRPVASDAIPYTFGNFIADMNPKGGSSATLFDRNFLKAVRFAGIALENLIASGRRVLSAEKVVEEAIANAKDKRLIILNEALPWKQILNKYSEPFFVIEPGSSGANWKVSAVRDNPNSFENRKDLPEAWAGKRDEEFAQITGVKDAIFCHNKRFVAHAKSKEGAMKLAEKALQS